VHADDTVLFSESITELQNMINTVNKCSKQHGLYINLLKTKIVVFRNRGVLKENEKWYLDGKMIELFTAVINYTCNICIKNRY
jgi:hypothetical protein